MGTNYYLVKGDWPEPLVPRAPLAVDIAAIAELARPATIHIGKSSYGWAFSLHVYPEVGIRTWDKMAELITLLERDGWRIEDEYRGRIPVVGNGHDVTIWDIIKRSGGRWKPAHSEYSRHTVDGRHCIGHGEGLWDYCVGDFS